MRLNVHINYFIKSFNCVCSNSRDTDTSTTRYSIHNVFDIGVFWIWLRRITNWCMYWSREVDRTCSSCSSIAETKESNVEQSPPLWRSSAWRTLILVRSRSRCGRFNPKFWKRDERTAGTLLPQFSLTDRSWVDTLDTIGLGYLNEQCVRNMSMIWYEMNIFLHGARVWLCHQRWGQGSALRSW